MNSKDLIKSIKTCEYCNKELDHPVILPCGETLCKVRKRF